MNNEDKVKDTILHEISHVLTPKQGHNNIWRTKAIEIGCDGERCYDGKEINHVKGKYVCQCPSCKKKIIDSSNNAEITFFNGTIALCLSEPKHLLKVIRKYFIL